MTAAVKLGNPHQVGETESFLSPGPREFTTTRADFEIQKVRSESEDEDSEVEQIEVVCCDQIRITSTGLVLEVHPGILGDYIKIVESPAGPIYKKKDADRFISKPQSSKNVRTLLITSILFIIKITRVGWQLLCLWKDVRSLIHS